MSFTERDAKRPAGRWGLLGHPLGHSLSPHLHGMISELTGDGGEYRLLDTAPEHLARRLPELDALDGFNVTVPYKNEIIAHLRTLSPEAEALQAVNTVRQGKGYNTDYLALRRLLPALRGKHALLLGCGGAARALATAALAGGCAGLAVLARNQEKGRAFIADLCKSPWIHGQGLPRDPELLLLDERALAARLAGEGADLRCDLLLQASSAGMWPRCGELPLAAPLAKRLLERCRPYVFDCVYNPLMTRLLMLAASARLPYSGGLPMLFWQGLEARRLWQPAADFAPAAAAAPRILRRLAAELRARCPQKILLCGFMGAGKTSLLAALRARLAGGAAGPGAGSPRRPELGPGLGGPAPAPATPECLDLDEEIERAAGRPIPALFAEGGEADFRARESACLARLLAAPRARSLILATGGGALVQAGAADAAHAAGAQIVYLRVDLEEALRRVGAGAAGRPMLAAEDASAFAWRSEGLYNFRTPLYEAAADLTLDASRPTEELAEELLAILGWGD